ncbi:MAG: hypothetical protein D6679_13840 [Candidatus Hydrogenedentota bacterium]|nr:MAG: hypothetical protein D6679_13840 [Candidatus Hydrogenedentota bacterium]
MTRRSKRWKSRLLVMLGGLFLSLMFCEVVLRLENVFSGKSFFTDVRNKLNRPLKPLVPFRTFGPDFYEVHDEKVFIVSSRGETYPLNKAPHTFRIVCMGGSTTENRAGHTGTHYPLELQKLLRRRFKNYRFEVINAGYSAYATPHSLILFELDVLSWHPDLVIISHNINDRSVIYWPNFRFDYSNKYSHPFYQFPNYQSRFTTTNLLFQHFEFYWFLKDWLNQKKFSTARYQLRQRSYGDSVPKLAAAVFERNLRSFQTLAAANHITVVFGSQPIFPNEEVFLKTSQRPYNNVVVYPMFHEYVAHHKIYNRIIEKVAKSTGSFFVDNDKIFDGNPSYFVDNVHYSKSGIKKLAQNYASLLEHILQEKSSSPSLPGPS